MNDPVMYVKPWCRNLASSTQLWYFPFYSFIRKFIFPLIASTNLITNTLWNKWFTQKNNPYVLWMVDILPWSDNVLVLVDHANALYSKTEYFDTCSNPLFGQDFSLPRSLNPYFEGRVSFVFPWIIFPSSRILIYHHSRYICHFCIHFNWLKGSNFCMF